MLEFNNVVIDSDLKRLISKQLDLASKNKEKQYKIPSDICYLLNNQLEALQRCEMNGIHLGEHISERIEEQNRIMDSILDADLDDERLDKELSFLEKIVNENNNAIPIMENMHIFNKQICLSNIRELLKTSNMKIGQFEKESGCQPGYISRLEKPENTTLPSLDFILMASKILKVSLDVLLTVPLASFNESQKYVVRFLEKLIHDTNACKLEWLMDDVSFFQSLDIDINGNVSHPLFNAVKISVPTGCEYPDIQEVPGFVSHYFGDHSQIVGNSYSLSLKKNTTLYLMDISNGAYKSNEDCSKKAKEIWMYNMQWGSRFIVGNQDNESISEMVDKLFFIVNENMKCPKISLPAKAIIDAFMIDDLGQNDELDPDDISF